MPVSIAQNRDCVEAMKEFKDKFFDLAIVDPPYRDKNQPTKSMRNKANGGNMKSWPQKPTKYFFHELFRVSINQIVWGANNFMEYLPSRNCFLFWHKQNHIKNYSDGELAWTSFDSIARCINIRHCGANTTDKNKIHPTQKPVALYTWCLQHYAQAGFKILDTHLGSGSSRIAAHNLGFDFWGYEIDKEYFDAQENRFNPPSNNLFNL